MTHEFRSLRVGIVANEFFDSEIGRVGGFGWAAKRAAEVFVNHPACNIEVYFLTTEALNSSPSESIEVNGSLLVQLNGIRLKNFIGLLPLKLMFY